MTENVALFLKDLFTIYDRGLIMDLVYLFQSKLPNNSANLKFEFLRIICDYEHYIQLNLPLPDRITDIPSLDMTLWTNHFLSGILIREVITQIKSEEWIPILTAVDCLFFLLVKHHVDGRYQHVLARACIPGIYFSFILQLADANENSRRCITDAPWAIRSKLLACFLWIAKNIQRKTLQQWWVKDTQKRIKSFFEILSYCITTFEYQRNDNNEEIKGLKSSKLRSTQAAAERLATKGSLSTSSGSTTSTTSGNQTTPPSHSASQPLPAPIRDQISTMTTSTNNDIKNQNLSREVTLTIIDLLMDFMNDNVAELRKPDSFYMDSIVISLLTLMLRTKQAPSCLCSLLSAVRHTIVMFPGPFFVDPTPHYCGEISFAVLRLCNSPYSQVRSKACAIFYLLLRVSTTMII